MQSEKCIRVFPGKNKWTPTDELAFVGDPPLFRPAKQPVKVSVTFSWDVPEGKRLAKAWGQYYSDVQLGGPAFGDPGGQFVPGQFIKPGVVITSRGCTKRCSWCFVPQREGSVRELEIKDGWVVQDNNLLACSKKHIEAVFAMLRRQRFAAIFKGGLDTTLLTEVHRKLFDTIRIGELWFACDSPAGIKLLKRASEILDGISQRKRHCYVLIGFNGETIYDAEKRLEQVYRLGFMPFAQLYQSSIYNQYPKKWQLLARKWSRPAAYVSYMTSLTKDTNAD